MNKKAMIEAKDWMSGLVGVIVLLAGLIPILERFTTLNLGVSNLLSSSAVLAALPFILAILGFYLAIESVIELTNSNHIGWLSFLIGVAVMVIGILPALNSLGVGPGLFGVELPMIVYNVIFVVEGVFLMIAMFAMEL